MVRERGSSVVTKQRSRSNPSWPTRQRVGGGGLQLVEMMVSSLPMCVAPKISSSPRRQSAVGSRQSGQYPCVSVVCARVQGEREANRQPAKQTEVVYSAWCYSNTSPR